MKIITRGLVIFSTATLSLPAAAGHLLVVNKASRHINVQCGHDGSAGKVAGVEHGRSKSVDLNGKNDILCTAYNESGHKVTTRTFNFHHGDEAFIWKVSASHH